MIAAVMMVMIRHRKFPRQPMTARAIKQSQHSLGARLMACTIVYAAE
jgi:hypothetical protein